MTDTYNYEHFDAYVRDGADQAEFAGFADHLHVGEAAPDAALTRLDDGEQVALSSLWSDSYAVLEFGSFT
ncbi:MAG: hypothetical protein KY437_08785 [Actinobacteria bacterium]|nr:hypothetical protein [Actinomycetota bacterium]